MKTLPVQKIKKILPYPVVLGGFFLLLAMLIIVSFSLFHKRDRGDLIMHEEFNSNYTLTNPILDCEAADGSYDLFLPYKKVQEQIASFQDQYGINSMSVYFRDLNNGQWIGINEKESFYPASLAKLPVAIAFYSLAEKKSGILNKEVIIKEKDISNITQNITPQEQTIVGQSYTIEELLKRDIIYSDNIANDALLNYLPESNLFDVFSRIGIPLTDMSSETVLRTKDYAAFFRVLYNASYLNRDDSEKLLNILTQTTYKDGIVAGVPNNVTVAHKFGERKYINGTKEETQLHDCGIVYHNVTPYLLCVMTQGDSLEQQNKFIQSVSKYFYDEVEKFAKEER